MWYQVPAVEVKRGQHTALGTTRPAHQPWHPVHPARGAQQTLGEGVQPRNDATKTMETINVLPTGATVPGPRPRWVGLPTASHC